MSKTSILTSAAFSGSEGGGVNQSLEANNAIFNANSSRAATKNPTVIEQSNPQPQPVKTGNQPAKRKKEKASEKQQSITGAGPKIFSSQNSKQLNVMMKQAQANAISSST